MHNPIYTAQKNKFGKTFITKQAMNTGSIKKKPDTFKDDKL